MTFTVSKHFEMLFFTVTIGYMRKVFVLFYMS